MTAKGGRGTRQRATSSGDFVIHKDKLDCTGHAGSQCMRVARAHLALLSRVTHLTPLTVT